MNDFLTTEDFHILDKLYVQMQIDNSKKIRREKRYRRLEDTYVTSPELLTTEIIVSELKKEPDDTIRYLKFIKELNRRVEVRKIDPLNI